MIVPNDPERDAVALTRRVAARADALTGLPAADPGDPRAAAERRLRLAAELLLAATQRTVRAMERNVPRAEVRRPRFVRALFRLVLPLERRLFARSREVADDQHQALIASLGAMHELLAAEQEVLRLLTAPGADAG